jgi:hypothetical protein
LLGRLLGFGFGGSGRVDPDRGGRALGLWVPAFETGWVGREGDGEGVGADLQDLSSAPLVEVGGGQKGDPRVVVVVVVPMEEGLAVDAGVMVISGVRRSPRGVAYPVD